MKTKNIELIAAPPEVRWVGDGFRIHNFFPGSHRLNLERMSPFILLDYNSPHYFPPTDKPKGVGVHPHRGFETVTIAYKGRVEHHDSTGAGGIIGEGEVQWMTASSGILHKEFHEKEWSKEGGIFHVVQLWVNLPKKDKMSPPQYQAITREMIRNVELEDDNGMVEIISGEYQREKGPATTFTPINLMNAKLQKGGKARFSFPEHYTTLLLVIEGNIVVNNTDEVKEDHLALFEYKGEDIEIESLDQSTVLILSGEPIQEPIVARGPFVMNTMDEIIQAYEDFNSDKFGYLED